MNKSKDILIVEDTISHADFMIKILSHHGYSIVLQNTALGALECVRKQLPCLILIDIGLPDMDGKDLMKELRKICETQIPMIAVTAHSMADTKDILLNSGFDGYLSKPFKIEDLVETVKFHINHE